MFCLFNSTSFDTTFTDEYMHCPLSRLSELGAERPGLASMMECILDVNFAKMDVSHNWVLANQKQLSYSAVDACLTFRTFRLLSGKREGEQLREVLGNYSMKTKIAERRAKVSYRSGMVISFVIDGVNGDLSSKLCFGQLVSFAASMKYKLSEEVTVNLEGGFKCIMTLECDACVITKEVTTARKKAAKHAAAFAIVNDNELLKHLISL